MAADSSLVRSVLIRVVIDGAVVIPQKELLLYLGWQQNRPNAWKDLLDFWSVEMGYPRASLCGFSISNNIVLNVADVGDRVEEWAQASSGDVGNGGENTGGQ